MSLVAKYPSMRWSVLDALACLADEEYQRERWTGNTLPRSDWFDDLTLNINILFDDCEVLPDPQKALGAVLVPGDDFERLRRLGAVLSRLIDRHGKEPDINYLNDPEWQEVIRLAGLALAAMVRARGLPE
jgi:hypothetical protein